jgi:hypothetical protein
MLSSPLSVTYATLLKNILRGVVIAQPVHVGALVKARGFYTLPGRWVFDLGAVAGAAAGGSLIRAAPWWPWVIGAGIPSASEWPRGCDCVEGLHKGGYKPSIPRTFPSHAQKPVSLYVLTVILLFLYIAQP